MVRRLKGIFVFCSLSLFCPGAYGQTQTKVVVIPMGGEAAPQFRIVATKDPVVAGEGRLEYTEDPNPGAQSIWGKVCDDCFEGDNSCPTSPAPGNDKAAHAICKDLGYATGVVDKGDSSANDGVSFFALDDVTCPDDVSSSKQCTSTTAENCEPGEEVYIQCLDTLPRLVYQGFQWSCSGQTGSVPSFPDQFVDLNDDVIANPYLVAATFGEGEMREGNSEFGPSISIAYYDNKPTFGGWITYESHDFLDECPLPLQVANRSWSFDITSTNGRIWNVSSSFSATTEQLTYEDLVFELKP